MPMANVEPGRAVLADLHQARQRRRTQGFDKGEAFYRAYLTAILVGLVLLFGSAAVGDGRLRGASVATVATRGPQIVGLLVALVVAVGLRSGGRGGPLVIEAAEVRHVLLSPLDRAVALRPAAWRQLRFGMAGGAGVGVVAGLLAFRRLPGAPVAWLACGAAVGALTAAGGLGAAMAVAGRRLGQVVGGVLALVVLAWSGADLALRTTTSPCTLLGQVGLWPARFRPTGLIGVAVLTAVAAVGVAAIAGTSVEAAERRATLVGQIRFAATVRDLRTVVVLRRQLSQELPRQRPWLRLARTVLLTDPPGSARVRRWPTWRRGWHGILRFPGPRFIRMALLGAAAGGAAAGVWRGTTPLVVVAGLALYVAGLDAVEPLAQELDHPDRLDSYAVDKGLVLVRQLGPSAIVMLGVAAIGALVAYAASGAQTQAIEVGAVLVVPAGLAGVAGACISVVQGPPPTFSSTDSLLPPEAAGARAVSRMVIPPAVATAGILPILAGRHPAVGVQPVAAVAGVIPLVLIPVVLVGVWLRQRERLHAWFRSAMDEASPARRSPPPAR